MAEPEAIVVEERGLLLGPVRTVGVAGTVAAAVAAHVSAGASIPPPVLLALVLGVTGVLARATDRERHDQTSLIGDVRAGFDRDLRRATAARDRDDRRRGTGSSAELDRAIGQAHRACRHG